MPAGNRSGTRQESGQVDPVAARGDRMLHLARQSVQALPTDCTRKG
jgi:hypothetical protein